MREEVSQYPSFAWWLYGLALLWVIVDTTTDTSGSPSLKILDAAINIAIHLAFLYCAGRTALLAAQRFEKSQLLLLCCASVLLMWVDSFYAAKEFFGLPHTSQLDAFTYNLSWLVVVSLWLVWMCREMWVNKIKAPWHILPVATIFGISTLALSFPLLLKMSQEYKVHGPWHLTFEKSAMCIEMLLLPVALTFATTVNSRKRFAGIGIALICSLCFTYRFVQLEIVSDEPIWLGGLWDLAEVLILFGVVGIRKSRGLSCGYNYSSAFTSFAVTAVSCSYVLGVWANTEHSAGSSIVSANSVVVFVVFLFAAATGAQLAFHQLNLAVQAAMASIFERGISCTSTQKKILEATGLESLIDVADSFSNKSTKIFLSYSRSQIEIADQVELFLHRKMFCVIRDENDFRAGIDLRQLMKMAVADSHAVILLWNQEAACSKSIQFEVNTSIDMFRRVFVIDTDGSRDQLPNGLDKTLSLNGTTRLERVAAIEQVASTVLSEFAAASQEESNSSIDQREETEVISAVPKIHVALHGNH